MAQTVRIALDAMGGDFSPENEVLGAFSALSENSFSRDVEIYLVGDEQKIKNAISKHKLALSGGISIIPAKEVVTMKDDPLSAIKYKRDSSLFLGVDLVKQGKADAFVSTGNTGAVMATGTLLLGKIQGVSRPTIGSFFPTEKETPTLVVDVGANIDCKSRHLFEFAAMGDVYFTNATGKKNPTVGLLNIGEEESKGGDLLIETNKALKESSLNFVGNVEGRDILKGTVDIVVCDGYVGNVALKLAESALGLIKSKIKKFASQSAINKLLAAFMALILKRVLKDMDYQEYGGVPLLGVNGIVIIGHGKSSPAAIKSMLFRAKENVIGDINKKIENALK